MTQIHSRAQKRFSLTIDMNKDEVIILYDYLDRIMEISPPTIVKTLFNEIKNLHDLTNLSVNNKTISDLSIAESDYDNMLDTDMLDEVVRLNEP